MSLCECEWVHYDRPYIHRLDYSKLGPHLFMNSNMQKCLMMSHLPRLLYQKWGKCIIHYDPDDNPEVVLSVFSNNPYVTRYHQQKFPIKIDMLGPYYVRPPALNAVNNWSRCYGFMEDSTTLPELYLDQRFNPMIKLMKCYSSPIKIAIFCKDTLKPWGFEENEVIQMFSKLSNDYDGLIDFFQVGSIGLHLHVPRVCYVHHQPKKLFYFLSLCDLYIGSANTGVMHAAAALKIPSLIIEKNYHQAAHGTWCYPENEHIMTQLRDYDCRCKAQVSPTIKDLHDRINTQLLTLLTT